MTSIHLSYTGRLKSLELGRQSVGKSIYSSVVCYKHIEMGINLKISVLSDIGRAYMRYTRTGPTLQCGTEQRDRLHIPSLPSPTRCNG